VNAALYEITYAVADILGTYITYKLLRIFFDEQRSSRKIEFLSYMGYYLINAGVFFLARIPAVMISVNLVMFFCLTFNYHATMRKRIMTALLSYMILMGIEILIGVVTSPLTVSFLENIEYASVTGILINNLTALFVVSVISRMKNVKREFPVPRFYWFSMVFIPAASLFLLIAYLGSRAVVNQAESITFIIIILAVNFIVLFIYDDLYKAFSEKSKEQLRQQQISAYENQMEIMRQSLKNTEDIRHDVTNHIIAIRDAYAKNKTVEAEEHISNILNRIRKKPFIDSGNVAIDSIINFKMQAVVDMGISPVIKVTIPQDLKIPGYETVAILGNLLDNAIFALGKCKDDKIFSIDANYRKSNLIITVVNSYEGKIMEKNGEFLTTKWEEGHGNGLRIVRETLDEISGDMYIRYDGREFIVSVVFPAV